MYYTKDGTTPVKFRGLLNAVYVCRARQKAGLTIPRDLPFWGERAYLLGTGVFSQVEAEINDTDEDETIGTGMKLKGKGDSDAFKLIAEHLEQDGR